MCIYIYWILSKYSELYFNIRIEGHCRSSFVETFDKNVFIEGLTVKKKNTTGFAIFKKFIVILYFTF